MNCEEFRAGYLAGEQRPHGPHLQHCSACRAELSRLDEIQELLGEPFLWEEPSAGLEVRVVEEIAGSGRAPLRRRRLPWLLVAALAVTVGTAALTAVLFTGGQPHWEVTMAGTEHAPLASATVQGWNQGGGVRMELTVQGLPRTPPDHYYELWLSAPGRIVSGGSFQGNGTVTLTSGVARAEVPRLWVTLETLDGEPAPSKVTVLDSG